MYVTSLARRIQPELKAPVCVYALLNYVIIQSQISSCV